MLISHLGIRGFIVFDILPKISMNIFACKLLIIHPLRDFSSISLRKKNIIKRMSSSNFNSSEHNNSDNNIIINFESRTRPVTYDEIIDDHPPPPTPLTVEVTIDNDDNNGNIDYHVINNDIEDDGYEAIKIDDDDEEEEEDDDDDKTT